MFNRLTPKFSALPPKTLLTLFRSLMEGDLTLEQVLNAGNQNALDALMEHSSQIGNVTQLVESFPAKKNIQLENNIVPLTAKQLSVGFAINELVNVYAYKIYAIHDVSTDTQCFALNALKNNLFQPVVIRHEILLGRVTEFQKILNGLLNSWIDKEARSFAELVATCSLEAEVTRRTPVNKTISALLVVRDRLKKEILLAQRSIFAKASYADADAICKWIDKIPVELDVSSPKGKELIKTVNEIHAEVLQLIASECNSVFQSGLMRKLWNELHEMVATKAEHDKMPIASLRK